MDMGKPYFHWKRMRALSMYVEMLTHHHQMMTLKQNTEVRPGEEGRNDGGRKREMGTQTPGPTPLEDWRGEKLTEKRKKN
ncbi:hypothetical protein ACOMHN_032521 [Nucella lapillus]